MLTPKGSTYNGRQTFTNPMYHKKAQSEKPCLYEIPYDTSDLANKFTPDREETLTLEQETWEKHVADEFRAPTAQGMTALVETCLMPLAIKTQNDSFKFVHELKQEMFTGLQYVQSLEKEIDEHESDKADFSNIYDLLLQGCVSKDVMCSYFHSLFDLDAHTELQFTSQSLPQTTRQAVRNTNVIKPGMYRIDTGTTQIRAPQLSQTSRNTDPRVSTSTRIMQLILFIVDSGCIKYMTGNLKLLCNFVEKFLGTVRFRNDQFVQFLVTGIWFKKISRSTRDLQGNDLLIGNRGSDLYTISLQGTISSTPICFMAKASPTQACYDIEDFLILTSTTSTCFQRRIS
ncbi:hypothetical protein Tco_0743844 [Tanacetum coccineum]